MKDKELIEKLGGVNAVAKFFGFRYNTVYNWIKRGVPSKVKVQHPNYFLTDNPPNLNKETPNVS